MFSKEVVDSELIGYILLDEDKSIEEEDKDIVVEIPENNMPKDEPKVNSTKTIILIIIGVFEAVIKQSPLQIHQ